MSHLVPLQQCSNIPSPKTVSEWEIDFPTVVVELLIVIINSNDKLICIVYCTPGIIQSALYL